MKIAILLLAVLTLLINTVSATPEAGYGTQIMICDHNYDGVRNLQDVSLFAQCKDSFDANEDGVHDLSDVGLYAQNYADNNWCRVHTSECGPAQPVDDVPEFSLVAGILVLMGSVIFALKRR